MYNLELLNRQAIMKTLILGTTSNHLIGDKQLPLRLIQELRKIDLGDKVVLSDEMISKKDMPAVFKFYDRIIILSTSYSDTDEGDVRLINLKYKSDYGAALGASSSTTEGEGDADYPYEKMGMPEVFLFIISIDPAKEIEAGLSKELESKLPNILDRVVKFVQRGDA